MDILLSPRIKPTEQFLSFLISRWHPSDKGPKLTKFDPTNYISTRHLDMVHLMNFCDLSQNPRWPLWPPFQQITKSVITWKVYKLETHLYLDPCFQGLGMQWSYLLRDMISATTPKFKMAVIWVKIGVWRLNTYWRGVIILWELQIDGSINYWIVIRLAKCPKTSEICQKRKKSHPSHF